MGRQRFYFCCFLVTALIVLLAYDGKSATYKWEDESGTVFFTDDPERIPPRYRRHVEERVEKEPVSLAPLPLQSNALFEQKMDLRGNNMQWWQDLIGQWEKKKKLAEDRIQQRELEIRQLESAKMATEDWEKEKRRIEKQINTAKARRDLAIHMLKEGIPSEAQKAKAPHEWLLKR